MTRIYDNEIFKTRNIDLLVGGTRSQSFSVAGERGGIEDDRGNLALVYCELAKRSEPRWVVWENVPGVMSSNGGRDFGSFLGALGKFGYGYAYRVLDAQHFGVPQRRRRIFVVGYRGDWRPAAAVLFEPPSGAGLARQRGALPEIGLDEVRPDPKAERVFEKDGEQLSCNSGSVSRTLQARGPKRLNPGYESYITDGRGLSRYLTPTEWERLMGFEDGFTQIPFKGKGREKCRRRCVTLRWGIRWRSPSCAG